MKINIKKLNDNAIIPTRGSEYAAGYDLYAGCADKDALMETNVIKPYGTMKIHTGLAMEIPKGYVGLVFPRSSNRKTEAYLTNSVGVIDSGYRGEIMFSFKSRDAISDEQPYKVGDRVGQIIIIPYPQIEFEEVENLEDSNRGEDGHGSTGK